MVLSRILLTRFGVETLALAKNMLARLASSTFVLLVAGLCAVELFVRCANPLSWFDKAGLTTHNNRFVTKLPLILENSENRDVLLLGASGVLFSTVRTDDKFHGLNVRCDKWHYGKHILTYRRADYLENVLSNRTGRPVSVCNAAVAGSVVSDHYLVAKKYLASNKSPRIAVVFTAPRDFYDNTRTRLDQTFTYAMLADFTSLPELLVSGNYMQALAQSFSMLSNVAHQRGDFRQMLVQQAAKRTGHPETLFAASTAASTGKQADEAEKDEKDQWDDKILAQKIKEGYKPSQQTNMLDDMDIYKQMYLPVNDKQFDKQSEYMDKLLSMLRRSHIPTLVVDIPVTQENYSLLPAPALARYKNELRTVCSKYGALLDSPGTESTFVSATDFEDSAHMNELGGEKLFKSVADKISQEPQLAQALHNNAPAVAQTSSVNTH
jgi:hypothetical protein